MRPERVSRLAVGPPTPAGEIVLGFAATWPGLVLDLFDGEPDFYKDGFPEAHRLDPGRPVTARRKPAVVITGDLTGSEVRDLLHRAFGIEAQTRGVGRGETLDAAVRRLA